MIAVQKSMIIIFTMSLLASSSPKCSDILIMNFQEVLDSIAELRTWEGAHIAWDLGDIPGPFSGRILGLA